MRRVQITNISVPILRVCASKRLARPHQTWSPSIVLVPHVSTPRSESILAHASVKQENWVPDRASIDDSSQEIYDRLLTQFQQADVNGDGVLSREELRTVLEAVGNGYESIDMHWVTDEDMETMMKQYDSDGDGVISFDEFKVLAEDNVFLTLALAEYKDAFKAIDKGNNGRIGPTELYNLFQELDSPLQGYENIVALMEQYDLNQDGEIDFPEFLRLCRDEKRLPLDDILAYSATEAKPKEVVKVTSAPSVLRPGQVTFIRSEKEFVSVLDSASSDQVVVLFASLTWCRPCKKAQVFYEKCAHAYTGSTIFLKFHGNDNEDTKCFFKEKLKTRVTPTFFFFKNQELLDSCTGANATRFESTLRKFLNEEQQSAVRCLYP